MPYGLSDAAINKLIQVFAQYDTVQQVILYGSRAKGNYSEGSDVDLTLKGKDIDFSSMQGISNDIEQLLLPYLFDISIFNTLQNKDLVDHIQRVGVSIYKKSK